MPFAAPYPHSYGGAPLPPPVVSAGPVGASALYVPVASALDQAVDGYGVDVSLLPDLDAAFGLILGNIVLGEALIRRWTTPRGTLIYDLNYGSDVRAYLNASMDAKTLAQMQQSMSSEALKDPRVLKCAVSLAFDPLRALVTAQVQVQGTQGPFALTVGVSDLSVTLLSGGA